MRYVLTAGAMRTMTAIVVIVALPTLVSSQILVPPDRTTTIAVMSNGPVPTGVRVDGTPTVATVSWLPVSGAVKYTVMRAKDGDPACCNAQSGDITATTWTDNGNGSGIQWSGTYVYTIVAWQSTGVYGQTIVKWTRPDPMNPSGFTSKQTGEGSAELSWQAVPGASYYWVWGPGTGTEGARADGTSKGFTGIGSGPKEWSITTRYDPSGFLLPSSTWPKTQLNMVTHSGMYRITLNGFEVSQISDEEKLNIDGAGTEVLALAYLRSFDRASGRLLNEGSMESAVHGDTQGYQGRVPAGTASPTGGLVAGNKFPGTTPWLRGNSVSSTTFPLLLWEGSLTDGGQVIVISPMLFEWESAERRNVDNIIDEFKALTPGMWPTVASALSASSTWGGPTQVALNPWIHSGPAITTLLPSTTITHAIGGTIRDGRLWWVPHNGIVITRELVELALSGQSQVGAYGPGVIPVRLADKSNNGNYVLYLQVARQ